MKNILLLLLKTQDQTRILHWQTKSYAQHMAFGNFYNALTPLIDLLVECYQGKYDRIYLDDTNTIELKDVSDDPESIFEELSKALSEDFTDIVDEKDTDLLNIRDEIIAEINKLEYLLTLK
jgi:hypothetical protein